MRVLHTVSLVAALLVAGACGGTAGEAQSAPAPAAAGTKAPATRHRHTEADVRFMSGMIGHHAQAITMSRLAETRAASPSVRTLAARIISAQEDEITTMQQWLRDRGAPVPEAHPAGAHAGHHAGAHAGHHAGHTGPQQAPMHGMLTAAQLQELEQASGEEFDRLFLRYMIQHHRGAVAMVKELFASPGAAQDETVFKFASDVNVDQTTEIARMERMLTTMILQGGSR